MNFGQQIRDIRKREKLTQEDMAQRLHVTRQAVSNWENDKNLPDLEMLISIAGAFHLTLDELILGGTNMNNMTEKLIRDTSETRLRRQNLVSFAIGGGLALIGVCLIFLKAASVEYIDEAGILHENFFLLPMAALFLFGAFVTFLVTGVRNLFRWIGKKEAGKVRPSGKALKK